MYHVRAARVHGAPPTLSTCTLSLASNRSVSACLPLSLWPSSFSRWLGLGWESGIDCWKKKKKATNSRWRAHCLGSRVGGEQGIFCHNCSWCGCGSRQAGRIICGAQRSQVVLRDSGTKLHASVIALTVRPGNNLGSRLDWNGPVPMSTWASTSPLPPRP
jgi:hypothetical protein